MLSAAALTNALLATLAAQLSLPHGGVAGPILAIVLLQPFGLVLFVAAIYVAAPFSRFGVWLDSELPRLHRRPPLLIITGALLVVSVLVVHTIARSLDGR